MLKGLLQATFSAGSYYFYNKMYFRLVCNSQQIKDPKRKWEAVTFIFNFILFYICSVLQLQLVFNWVIFSFFIFIETCFLYHCTLRNAAFLSLQGTICGLSANVFNRCLFAVILNKNLIAFANAPSENGNIKSVPIILGFISTACVFYFYAQEKQCQKLRLMFQYSKHMMFLFKVMIVMMFCLLVHLVLYNYDANDITLKLWGLSSAVFVITGYLLGLNYTIRLCELEEYKVQNEQLRTLVNSQQELENMLSKTVYLDELTGFYNRQFADQRIQNLLDKQIPFTLCFIDLNGLKYINDKLGHSEGDHYILMVSQELSNICEEPENCIRYGGDEFIILFQEKQKQEIMKQLDHVNHRLAQVPLSIDGEFYMSISYGVIESYEENKASALVASADAFMYEQKKNNDRGHRS